MDKPKVTSTQYFAIWQAFSDLIGDIATGIVGLVTAFETAQYPPDVLATYHARNYRDALNCMAKYKQMCPPNQLIITENTGNKEECFIDVEWQHAEEQGPPILIGSTLAYLLELGRRGTGQNIRALSVSFSHPMGDMKILENYFGCPIEIGSDRNQLTLKRQDLDLAFTTYNKELLEILTPVLNQTMDQQQKTPSMTETVKSIIKEGLMGSQLNIQSTAKELNMSNRTLQRRLTEEGTSFKQLLSQVRREEAKTYLADSSLDIKEVAYLVGYEDLNSFYRAFRMWEGVTPSNWRLENKSGHNSK